jgi:hypothetical protein
MRMRRMESIAQRAALSRPLAPSASGHGKGGGVTSQEEVRRVRMAAVRTGWNDAAWGRPSRQVQAALARFYERGYAGGLVFRRKQEVDIWQRAALWSEVSPQVPAA